MRSRPADHRAGLEPNAWPVFSQSMRAAKGPPAEIRPGAAPDTPCLCQGEDTTSALGTSGFRG